MTGVHLEVYYAKSVRSEPMGQLVEREAKLTSNMMWRLLILALSLSLTGAVTRFDGYKILRVVPRDVSQVHYLIDLADNNVELDFWTEPRGVGATVDIMVPPTMVDSFTSTLKTVGFDVTVNMEDVQAVIDLQMALNKEKRANAEEFDYTVYNTLDDINQWIDDITAAYPTLTEIFEVTTSYEGRLIRGVKVGNSAVPAQRKVFFHGCIHSREWITGATMLWTVKTLLEEYGADPDVTKYVDQIDFYIVPIMNPDGYEWTWTDNRMWRKTRSPNDGSICMGTDPNRNWGVAWGEIPGASDDPCSGSYHGPYAFSEVETKGASDWILENKPDCYIDFHAYSQMWMSPWSYTYDYPEHLEIQNRTNKASVDALEAVYGTKYTYGPIAHTIYVATGSTADWGYGEAGIIHTHATELRDTGEYGFLLPEDQIEATGIETFEAIKATCEIVLEDE
ncbi:carboxypeptidase B-like [Glandiceps talaboti]